MMPTSAPGACNSSGFTLVEILVVLLVIGIVAAAVTANISPGDRQSAEIEASRLADLLEEAAEEAKGSGEAIAWSGEGDAYRFWKKADGSWNEIVDDDLFRRRALQNRVWIGEIRVDGIQLLPGQRLVFNPSGVNRPFEIVLFSNQVMVRISGDIMNRVKVKQ